MEQKIKCYVDSVFRDVPSNERAQSIKSEILSNLLDKYRDLREEGRSEEEAYAIAISSGGDLSGIVADLKGETVTYSYAYEKQFQRMYEKEYRKEKKKRAAFSSCLWPCVLCFYLLFSFLVPGAWAYSWILFPAAAAVDNLVAFLLIKSNPKKKGEAGRGALWLGILSFYFILSYTTHRWDITWIIFLIGVALSQLFHTLRESKWRDMDEDGE